MIGLAYLALAITAMLAVKVILGPTAAAIFVGVLMVAFFLWVLG